VLDRHKGDISWQVLEDGPAILASNFREGQFGWISGIPGTGKTVTGLKIIEQWMGMGNVALSNIRIEDRVPSESFRYVRDAREMFLAIADSMDRPWLMVLDEAALSGWYRGDATRRKDKDLDKFARIIRKLGGNLILIEQREASVPTIVQEFASSRYYCHRVGGGVVTVDLRGPYRYWRAKIQDLPNTIFRFRTEDIAFFPTEEVLEFEELYRAIASTDDIARAIRDYLKP